MAAKASKRTVECASPIASGGNKQNRAADTWAFPSPDAWKERDKILAKMQQLGASPEDIRKIVGPSPPRIDSGAGYCLLPGIPPPELLTPGPGEGWMEGWRRRSSLALQKYQARQMATYRQGYSSFFGAFPQPSKRRRTLNPDGLIESAAMRLLGHQWKQTVPTAADDLEKDTGARRKAVTELLEWTRLDPASIARNRAAEARRIILEIETKELNAREQNGLQLTDKDLKELEAARKELAAACSELAQLAGAPPAKDNTAKPRKAIGRPKKPVDGNRVRELRSAGASWSKIAADLKISATTARRVYIQTPRRLAKSL